MANPRKRVPENVDGDLFVHSTCIDCDACRQIAPAVFGEAAATSFVKAQPSSIADRRQAFETGDPSAKRRDRRFGKYLLACVGFPA
jgi:4Fe-4S single cluster domain of Ferredoxin I